MDPLPLVCLQLQFFPTLKTQITLIHNLKFLVMIQALDCQWFSTRGHFPPRRTFINVWRHFWLSHLWGREGAIGTLVGRGQGYNECTGKPPQWRNFLAQMSVVPKLSNAGLSISHTAHVAVTFWIILTLFS